MLLSLSLAALLVPRWGRYGRDAGEALALLAGSLGGIGGAGLSQAVGWPAAPWSLALLGGICLTLGRQHSRRPTMFSMELSLRHQFADLGRALWNLLDDLSWQIKPLLEGTLALVGVALLAQAAGGLPAGGKAGLSIGGALWLGVGVGLGLAWGRRGVWRWLLPLAGGALGGWQALGMGGAIFGSCLGVGVAVGEWLAETRGRGEGNLSR